MYWGGGTLPCESSPLERGTLRTPTATTRRQLRKRPLKTWQWRLAASGLRVASQRVAGRVFETPDLGYGATLLEETSYPLKVTEDIWFACCSCTHVTKDQRGIVSHLAAHGDKQSKCQHPPMSGSKTQVLGNTQKQNSEKPFKCKLCPQKFAYNSILTFHNQTHTGVKPFRCKLCPQAFARNSYLQSHNNVHTGEKPFKCKQCPKAFAQYSSLRKHFRAHTGEKPFTCKYCLKALTQFSSLQRHNQTHAGEKPFKWRHCPKAFAQNSYQKDHNRTHTGEKPFMCKHCPKAFARNSSLKNHIGTHTDDNFQLVYEIEKRKRIIKNKINNNITKAAKRKAWQEIASVANSRHPSTLRTVPQLKKQWQNLKSRSRAELTLSKRADSTTGAGRNDHTLTPLAEAVLAVIGSTSPNLLGIEGGIDTDE
ncbi:zinc finger protein 782-like [Ixodes scapularis]|uniref:zinc finger protein 782-like n=1 Tax=Ixodes scapularis TaxID=6945 RepID=UPI001C38EFCE|nr:zinc finger protein 782-like [Ixodes scapularis]